MPLQSRHFTQPKRNARLEQCLVSDPAHVTPGSQGDHVSLIQQSLNKLRDLPGGEDFRLMVSGRYDPETSAAVLEFKTKRNIVAPQRQNKADNVVGKMTIAALDEEMLALEQRQSAGKVDIRPPHGSLRGECDMNGFSRRRLARHGDSGNWTLISDKVPVHQMIPLGLTRTLRLSYDAPGDLQLVSDDPTIALVVDLQREAGAERRYLATILGRRAGTTDLAYFVGGIRRGLIRIPVRARSSFHLNAVYLGPSNSVDDFKGYAMNVFNWINLILTPQTNLLCLPITIRVEPRISYRGGPTFAIDPDKPLFILKSAEQPPPGEQAVTWRDLERFHQTTGVTLFYGRNLRALDESTVGENLNGTRLCWAPLRSRVGLSHRALVVRGAHEILHALGAEHIVTGENNNYVMTWAPTPKSWIIPSETLVDI